MAQTRERAQLHKRMTASKLRTVTVASSLVALFVSRKRTPTDARALAVLDVDLGRYLAASTAAWPQLPLDVRVFVGHVAERALATGLLPEAHAADLYLACACAYGVPGAHDAFEACYAETLARAVARKNASPAFIDETSQQLRERLFVASDGLPKIAEYGGRAALRTWLTIAASRAALMRLRGDARRREVTETDDALDLGGTPELAVMKRRYAADFAAALPVAFARLSDKERTLLQLHVIDRLGIDQLGELYKVGRSTAARWLASARTTLVDETRRELRAKLGLTDSEYQSLAALLRSQLDVSIAGLLRARP